MDSKKDKCPTCGCSQTEKAIISTLQSQWFQILLWITRLGTYFTIAVTLIIGTLLGTLLGVSITLLATQSSKGIRTQEAQNPVGVASKSVDPNYNVHIQIDDETISVPVEKTTWEKIVPGQTEVLLNRKVDHKGNVQTYEIRETQQ